MGNRQGPIKHSRTAKLRGEARKRRRKRAERREATAEIREARNAKMRAEGHPGWVNPNKPWWEFD